MRKGRGRLNHSEGKAGSTITLKKTKCKAAKNILFFEKYKFITISNNL